MKYFDAFTGIGGFTLGIQNIIPDAECIGFSEIDKYAMSIYEKHYPTHINYGDITKIRTEDIPDFNFLVGGFPCQSFSMSGKRLGFEDTRGTLFFELARILKDKRPRYFLFENVRGLLSHDNGKTFQTILGVLSSIGYEYQWQVLNSKNWVPQNRERVYIVGYFRGESRPKVFPIENSVGENAEIQRKEKIERTWVPCLTTRYGQRWCDEEYISRRFEIKIPSATKCGYEIAKEGDSIRLSHIGSKTGRGRVGKQQSQTLLTGGDMCTVQNSCIRKLTPLECERLQGFPSEWTKYGKDGNEISDNQRYKVIGNAITVPVIEFIIKQMKDIL